MMSLALSISIILYQGDPIKS